MTREESRGPTMVGEPAVGRDSPVGSSRAGITVIVVVSEGQSRPSELYREYAPPLRRLGRGVEFLFVGSLEQGELESLRNPKRAADDKMRVIDVARPMGAAALLRLALEHSEGEIVISLPTSFRVVPEDLPRLVEQVDRGSGVAVARRMPWVGSWLNRIQARSCDLLLNALTGAGFRDITCRTYAMRRSVMTEIPLYGGYSRFIPVLAQHEGFRVDEVDVRPHPVSQQTRLYMPNVYLGWLIDILGLFFLIRFTYRPLRFFGLIGGLLTLGGGIVLILLLAQRFAGQGLANRPMLVLGVLFVTLGVQFVALGLIGEIVVHFQVLRGSIYRLRPDEPSIERRASGRTDPVLRERSGEP